MGWSGLCTWGRGRLEARCAHLTGCLGRCGKLPRRPACNDTAYQYDQFGRRFSKSVNGLTVKYLFDEAGQEIREWSNGAFVRQYVYDSVHGALSHWQPSARFQSCRRNG